MTHGGALSALVSCVHTTVKHVTLVLMSFFIIRPLYSVTIVVETPTPSTFLLFYFHSGLSACTVSQHAGKNPLISCVYTALFDPTHRTSWDGAALHPRRLSRSGSAAGNHIFWWSKTVAVALFLKKKSIKKETLSLCIKETLVLVVPSWSWHPSL